MGMGQTGALRQFRRETGATPHAYAMQLRLRLARCALSAEESAAEVVAARGLDRHAEIGDDAQVLDGEIVMDQQVLARVASRTDRAKAGSSGVWSSPARANASGRAGSRKAAAPPGNGLCWAERRFVVMAWKHKLSRACRHL